MEWIYLLIAGIFETGWAISMKYSEGFTKIYPTLFTLVFLVISMSLLEKALRVIPVGTGYAVWTGIGILGTTLLGIFLFNESMDIVRLVCISLIVIGIMGLKVLAPQWYCSKLNFSVGKGSKFSFSLPIDLFMLGNRPCLIWSDLTILIKFTWVIGKSNF